MSLAASSRFGPYQIIAPLGSGGMGEVYRAKDLRLQREVALKILRDGNGNPGGRLRLLDEARASGALNHPNILTVYDVGTEAASPFIVSELIEGTSLRRLVDKGALPVRELLDIAVQIADGLTAAHEAGLVHRDLKPENLMVTADGRVKILDFGIARPEDAPGGSSDMATETVDVFISGTVPYMSPEQAAGRKIDFRSDQFSFGLVLYEMASGSRAFAGETPVQTLSAIIAEDPPPLGTRARIPLQLRWIIERCLGKDPRQRYAATADLARDLRMLRDHLSEANADAGAPQAGPARRVWRRGAAAVAILAAGTLFAAGIPTIRTSPPFVPRFTPLANDPGYQGQPAWSPDGKSIAYAAEADGVVQIFVRFLSSSQRSQITHGRFSCRDPFWSRDGNRVFYISLAGERDGVFSVGATGGPPEPVILNAYAAALSPDGQTLALLRDEGDQGGSAAHRLWFSSPVGSEPRRYTRGGFSDRAFADGMLRFSPDGSKLGVWVQNWSGFYGGGPKSEFWIVPMADEDPIAVSTTFGDFNFQNYPAYFDWLWDNRRIVVAVEVLANHGLHLWTIDTVNGRVTPLTQGAGTENTPSVSPGGSRIAYATQDANFDLVEVPLDGSPARPLLTTTRNEMEPAWSPVHDEYVYVTDRRGRYEIWRRSHDGTFEVPVITDGDTAQILGQTLRTPVFSPDGQRIAFERATASGSRVFVSALTGGAPVPVTGARGTTMSPTWSANGEEIAFVSGIPGHWTLAKVRVGAATPAVVIREEIKPFTHPVWSPDNHWIAFNTSAGLSLVAPDGGRFRVIDEDAWPVYAWSADGATLYGIKQDPDNPQWFMLAAIDVASGRQRIINRAIEPVRPANAPVKGFSRTSAGTFVTSFVHVKSDIWLMDDFLPPPGTFERIQNNLRRFSGFIRR